MLSVSGLNRFYYVRDFTDMRCKHSRVLSIIRERLHREPSDGDVFIVMSKNRRIVRLFTYDHRSYSLFEKKFGFYRFCPWIAHTKTVSQISSCNGTRRTAGHVHPEVRI